MITPKPDDRLVDPRVADAWSNASREGPSASVDAAILAAARREVSARPEALVEWQAREARTSRRRWWPLAAAATIAAVAVGVLQLTPTDKLVSPAMETATVSDVPAPAGKPDAAVAPATSAPPAASPAAPATQPSAAPPAPFRSAKPAPQRVPPTPAATSAAPAEPRQQAAPAPAATPDPFPAAKKAAGDTAAAEGQVAASPPPPPRAEAPSNFARESESVARQAASPLAAAPAPTTPLAKMAAAPPGDTGAAEQRAKDRNPLPVADWIALIRRLRAEGKQEEAAKELAAFRAAHPDHEKLLPPDLRDWRPAKK